MTQKLKTHFKSISTNSTTQKSRQNFILIGILCILVFATHLHAEAPQSATDEQCQKYKEELKTLIQECRALKGQISYGECAQRFKAKKAAFQSQCSNHWNDGGVIGCGQSFENVFKDCERKEFKSSRCAATVRNLGTLNYKLEAQEVISCEDKYATRMQEYLDDNLGEDPDQWTECDWNFVIDMKTKASHLALDSAKTAQCLARAEQEDLLEMLTSVDSIANWTFCEWWVAAYIQDQKNKWVKDPEAMMSAKGLLYIAYGYLKLGNEKAGKPLGIELMQKIIELFADTPEATRAKFYLNTYSEEKYEISNPEDLTPWERSRFKGPVQTR